MGIVQVLDELPEATLRPPGRLWSVSARSLGELGAQGRAALAWRWALMGECPSPVTLGPPIDRAPGRTELLAEAEGSAELGRRADPGGEVMQARFVLRWLAGEIEALPLWNGGPQKLHVTDGAEYPHTRAHILYSQAEEQLGRLLQEFGPPRPTSPAYPFHHLTSDRLWAVTTASGGGSPGASPKALRSQQAAGRLTPDLAAALRHGGNFTMPGKLAAATGTDHSAGETGTPYRDVPSGVTSGSRSRKCATN